MLACWLGVELAVLAVHSSPGARLGRARASARPGSSRPRDAVAFHQISNYRRRSQMTFSLPGHLPNSRPSKNRIKYDDLTHVVIARIMEGVQTGQITGLRIQCHGGGKHLCTVFQIRTNF